MGPDGRLIAFARALDRRLALVAAERDVRDVEVGVANEREPADARAARSWSFVRTGRAARASPWPAPPTGAVWEPGL